MLGRQEGQHRSFIRAKMKRGKPFRFLVLPKPNVASGFLVYVKYLLIWRSMKITQKIKELTFVDGLNSELSLDGGNQGVTLEDNNGEGFATDLGDVRGGDEVSSVLQREIQSRRREHEKNRAHVLIFLKCIFRIGFLLKTDVNQAI